MKTSPHTHVESPLTGSTIATMVEKAKALGRTHFAYTDHGHLSSCLKTYSVVKKNGLKFIPGIEFYFKDSACQYVAGTKADRCRYFTATLYCETQEAYQELCKLVSGNDFPTIKIFDEQQQLWSWKHLEHMAKFDTCLVLGGVHCMVGKAMLAGEAAAAEKIFTRLKYLFPLYSSIVCEPWTKKWHSVVELSFGDGTTTSCLATDQVTTDKARRIKAYDLTEREGHTVLRSIFSNNIEKVINKPLSSSKLHKGFLPLPGGDALLKVNRFLKALSSKHGVPVMPSDYAYYANKEDKVVQTMRLEGTNNLQPNFYMKSDQEIYDYLNTHFGYHSDMRIDDIIKNSEEFAQRFNKLELKYDWHLAYSGENPTVSALQIIRENGRMRYDDPKYLNRLKEELTVIAKNPIKDLTPYFLPIRDVLNHYKENGQLVGPGRGSAGGSLFCYLLGITQIDPFKYDLPFSRFFSLDRIMTKELPDIDVDLENRTLLVGEDGHSGYLYTRFGDKAAQVSTRTTIRLKSAIKDVNRYFNGKVQSSIETFSKGLPPPPQGINDQQFVFGYEDADGEHIPGLIEQSADLKKYSEDRPQEWEIVSKAMGLTRAFSKHASAFVISDQPIKDVVPVRDGNITQYEAKECEAAGLIKYDFLVINQLKDIRVCMDLINKKNNVLCTPVGNFDHNREAMYIWDLPEVPEVFKSVWGGSTETIFQINTKSMVPYVKEILPSSIMDLATILALVRPGPMDFIDENTGRNMVDEYIQRRNNKGEPDIKELFDLLPETYGIIVFQEQLNKIARDLAGFPGEKAEKLRKNMAKKKMKELMDMKPDFIEGASKKTTPEVAEAIWERMVTFGRYGFSIIHAVEYAYITYACMFLKHFYPLEWWSAVLTNADEQEITNSLWPYVKTLVSSPDINLSSDTMVPDYANNKIRSKLGVIHGIGDATIGPIVEGRPYKDVHDFVDKDVCGPSLAHKLIHVGVLDSLFPPQSSLLEKLKMYEDAVERKKFSAKIQKAALDGKKVRASQPKDGVIPKEYIGLKPFKDAAMRKSVLPSLHINLHDLGRNHSCVKIKNEDAVLKREKYRTLLVNGARLKRLDEMEGSAVMEDRYVAATCFVVKVDEFSYPKKNPTKKALKVTLDVDGYTFPEKILWPDYETEKLEYPPELERGVITTVFFKKRAGKNDMYITDIVVENDK